MRSQPKVVTPAQRQRQLLYLVVIAFVVFMVVRSCAPHENRYEKNAQRVTEAIVKNDSSSIGSLFNADARENMTRARFGKASDQFATLGKINGYHEKTPSGSDARTHFVEVDGQNGGILEKYHYDIDGKIDRFAYDAIVPNTK
jgi:hypothetical protein